MNIDLIFQHKLLSGLQRFMWDAPVPMTQSASALRRVGHRGDEGIALASKPVNARVMPLRVLRVVETGQPRSCTGRLVISGRMADVCAELDRLVEREAALH